MNTLLATVVNASLEPHNILAAGGLSGAWDTIVNDWLGPIIIAIITVVAITLLIKKQIAGFITFALVAVVASVLVFNADSIFGKDKGITKVGSDFAKTATNSIDGSTFDPNFLTLP